MRPVLNLARIAQFSAPLRAFQFSPESLDLFLHFPLLIDGRLLLLPLGF